MLGRFAHRRQSACLPEGEGIKRGLMDNLRLADKKVAPKAIMNIETEPIVAVGAIIADISTC